MTSRKPLGAEQGDASQKALLRIHEADFGTKDPETLLGLDDMPQSADEALGVLVDADIDDVPAGTRLDALRAAAGSGVDVTTGKARELVKTITEASGSADPDADADKLADDIKAVAGGADVADTDVLKSLPPRTAALFGQDVCRVRDVKVNGNEATWIYSELLTTTPLAKAAAWVDPRNWPEESPVLFKEMQPIITPPLEIGSNGNHWHARFRERVELFNKEMENLLHCDFKQTSRYAAVTYKLGSKSSDGELHTNRGFLLAHDLGDTRLIKALKVVGFVDDRMTDLARTSCIVGWTDWIRKAVEEDPDSAAAEPTSSPGTEAGGGLIEDWFDRASDVGRDYTRWATDVTTGVVSGLYGPRDVMRSTVTYGSELARMWASAWLEANDLIREVASRPALDLTAAVTTAPRKGFVGTGTEWTTFPLQIDSGTDLQCSPLTSIHDPDDQIPASQIRTERQEVNGAQVARIEVNTVGRDAGLYTGEIRSGRSSGPGQPIEIYLSNAVEVR